MDDTDVSGFFENGCPKDTTTKKLLPHNDCRQYYECNHGGLISRFCPSGHFFDAKLEICDWKVNCHNTLEQIKNRSEAMMNETDSEDLDISNPGDAYNICQSPDSNGNLVAHENCNEFYKCVYGKPVNLKCAQHLLYNTMTEKCDWPHNVDCGDRVGAIEESHFNISLTNEDGAFPYTSEEIERSNSDPSQASTICSNNNSNGVLVAHEYCNRYYKCIAGVPKTVKCPINLLYNPIKESCDWPQNVDCAGRSIFENEDQNNSENVEKSNSNKMSFRDSKQNTATDICVTENSEGVSVAHQLCNHFYKCSGSEPIAHSCPKNLLYNIEKNYCDWPRNVACGDRTLPDTSDSENSKDNENGDVHQAICPSESSDGMLLPHEFCNQFYECHEGRPVALNCPPLLFYNTKTQSCEWPTYVSCDNRKLPSPPQSTPMF